MTRQLENAGKGVGARTHLEVELDPGQRTSPESAAPMFCHQSWTNSGLPGHVDTGRRPGEIERNRNQPSGRLRKWEAFR
jgi:hypothetical protein